MGESELTMEQSMGVMSGMAIRKVTCVMKKPSMEAMRIFPKSFFSTFSFGKKKERSQKSKPAPNERTKNKVMGESR